MRILISYVLFAVCYLPVLNGCKNRKPLEIRTALARHHKYLLKGNGEALTSLRIDSLNYSLTDSSAYYLYFLKVLEKRTDHFAKMARLRADLAQSHADDFLSTSKSANILKEKSKQVLDKSLELLQTDESEWNRVNDSMDLILNALQQADTSKKDFYKTTYVLKLTKTNRTITTSHTTVLQVKDLKVVTHD